MQHTRVWACSFEINESMFFVFFFFSVFVFLFFECEGLAVSPSMRFYTHVFAENPEKRVLELFYT